MTLKYADQATKILKKAVPTVNTDGDVIAWDLEIEYSLNDYVSTFNISKNIEPTKAPSEFTKAELFDIVNVTHLDAVYDSQYQSVKLAVPSTEIKVDDFDVDSLA